MEPQRGLGWAAIAVGLVLLGYMLGARGGEWRWQGYGPPAFTQPAPGFQQAPGVPPGYQQAPGVPPGYGPRGFGGHAPFFFGPLFLLAGLLKLALLGLLLLAALRFFGGRRPWGGPPWGSGPEGGRGEPGREEGERKGPEQPTSYTGGTTRL